MVQKTEAKEPGPYDSIDKRLQCILNVRVSLDEILRYMHEYLSVNRWLLGVSGDSLTQLDVQGSTVRHYVGYLIKFCMLVGKSPDEIIEERFKIRKSSNTFIQTKYEVLAQSFSQGYKQQGKLTAAREAVVALKSFFTKNATPLLIKSPRKCLKEEKFRLTIEEIKKILKYCDIRERAIFLILLQSGMRPETLLLLTYGDIKIDFESKTVPLKIYIPVTKVKGKYAPYMVLLGKDACEALQEYFNYRRCGTEKIEREIIKDNSPLIAKISKPEHISYGELRKLCEKIGPLLPTLGINKKVKLYVFRRTFETIMEKHMPINWVDRLMGHIKYRGIQGEAYSTPTIEELVESYKEAEPYISVSEVGIDKKPIQLEVMTNLAKMLNINLEEIMRRKGATNLNEMSDEEICSLYDIFREALKTLLTHQPVKPQDNIDIFKKSGGHTLNPIKDSAANSGEYEFEIIPEEELIKSLENGFELLNELSDHRFLVRRKRRFGSS